MCFNRMFHDCVCRCPVAVAVPRVHDLRAEELPVGETLRARLVHRQSARTPASGSHAENHQRVLASALPRVVPRREGLPLSVSSVSRLVRVPSLYLAMRCTAYLTRVDLILRPPALMHEPSATTRREASRRLLRIHISIRTTVQTTLAACSGAKPR